MAFEIIIFLTEPQNTSPTLKIINIFSKKLTKEFKAEIKTFFNAQKCNIENSDFRKKPIVDFQEKIYEGKNFQENSNTV